MEISGREWDMSLVLRERARPEIKIWGVNWPRDQMRLQESESK